MMSAYITTIGTAAGQSYQKVGIANIKIVFLPCADPESFFRRGPTLTTFFLFRFLVDEGREDSNTTLSGPSSACQQYAI